MKLVLIDNLLSVVLKMIITKREKQNKTDIPDGVGLGYAQFPLAISFHLRHLPRKDLETASY